MIMYIFLSLWFVPKKHNEQYNQSDQTCVVKEKMVLYLSEERTLIGP